MKELTLGAERYVLVVLRILEVDAHGRPSKCEVGYDDTTFHLSEDQAKNHFITAYVKEDLVKIVSPTQ